MLYCLYNCVWFVAVFNIQTGLNEALDQYDGSSIPSYNEGYCSNYFHIGINYTIDIAFNSNLDSKEISRGKTQLGTVRQNTQKRKRTRKNNLSIKLCEQCRVQQW